MKQTVHSKSIYRFSIICLAFLFYFSITALLWASENSRKSLDLYFNLENQELRLKEVVSVTSFAPKSTYLKSGFKIEMFFSENKLLFETYFPDPRIVFYDLLDTNRFTLSGGIVFQPQKLFKIRIPYLPEAEELHIINPAGTESFRGNLNQIITQIRKAPIYSGWDVDTLIYNGDPSNRIDLIFLGDGYTIDDTALYTSNVQTLLSYMFDSFEPYNEYRTYFNVFKVNVISQESGATHLEWNPPVYRNTALGTYYGCDDVAWLICANSDSVYSAAQAVPWYDEIVVLINDSTPAGISGLYSYCMFNNGSLANKLFMHEIGHGFAHLADEYLYGNWTGTTFGCNCDPDSANPGWQSWIDIGSPGVATFRECSYTNLFRSTYNHCMMKSLSPNNNYCVVCREQAIRRINELVCGYDDFSPSTDTLSLKTSTYHQFEFVPLAPATHSLKFKWFVNDQLMSSENPFNFMSSFVGPFTVKGIVYDSTEMVLDDPLNLLADSREWQVRVVPGDYLCGDPNQDSSVSVTDVLFTFNYLYRGGPGPVPFLSGDVNLDREVTLSDVIYLINYLFKGGLEPCYF